MVTPFGDPKRWPAEAWYGLIAGAAWTFVAATVGVVRDRFDPEWLSFVPTLLEWTLFTMGLCAVASLAMQLAAVRAAKAAPARVARELSGVIDQAAADGKFRARQPRVMGQTGGWSNDTIRISATRATYPIPWSAFRDELRPRRASVGGLSGVFALTGRPAIVTVTVTSMAQDRILRNVRLEIEDGAVRAFVEGDISGLSQLGDVTAVEPDPVVDPPRRAIFALGNLDHDTPVILHLIAETNSFSLEPNDFRWYLFEDEKELGSGRLQRIITD